MEGQVAAAHVLTATCRQAHLASSSAYPAGQEGAATAGACETGGVQLLQALMLKLSLGLPVQT